MNELTKGRVYGTVCPKHPELEGLRLRNTFRRIVRADDTVDIVTRQGICVECNRVYNARGAERRASRAKSPKVTGLALGFRNITFAPVVGYEGLYKAGSDGSVWNVTRKRKLSQSLSNGLFYVSLSKGGVDKLLLVHRVICAAFLGEERYVEVRHIDGIKTNNSIDNLEWGEQRPYRWSGNSPRAVVGVSIDTGEEIRLPSVRAAKVIGFDAANIHRVLRGQSVSHKNYQWRYA